MASTLNIVLSKDIKYRRKKTLNFGNFYVLILMIVPAVLLYTVFYVLPTLASCIFSFTNFDGVNIKAAFVGLLNYKTLFCDEYFIHSIINTFIFAILITIIQNILGLAAAFGLNTPIKGRNIMRTISFAPFMMSAVVVSYAWSYIYATDGVINIILQKIGFGILSKPWLAEESLVIILVSIAHVWRFIGYSSAIFIANLQTIPIDLIEVSRIDGASRMQRFIHVVFPMLAPSTTINIVLSFLGSLKIFDTVYTLTGGGPGYASEVMAINVYKNMGSNLYGYAAACSVVMTAIILIFNGILYKYLAKREEKL